MYGGIFGWSQNNYARLVIVGFQALASAAVFACPSFASFRERAWAVTLFVGLVASVWIVDGLYLFEYYPVSASLITVMMACFVVPAWRGVRVSNVLASLSGVCSSLAVFTSHAWLPTIAALFISTLFRAPNGLRAARSAKSVAISFVVASTFCLVWLKQFGSIRGFVTFHILFVHTVYLQVVTSELTLTSFVNCLTPSLSPEKIPQDLAIAALLATAFCGYRIYSWRALTLGLLGVLLADARGKTGFAAGTFVVIAVALTALTIAQVLHGASKSTYPSLVASFGVLALVAVCEISMWHAISSPGKMTRSVMVSQPRVVVAGYSDAPMFLLIRKLVRPDERMLALVYRPDVYWAAARLPMRGFYEYLPDDALYARQPLLGLKRDLCAALHSGPPPVIVFDNWNVWGRFPPAVYMPCVLSVLKSSYMRAAAWKELYIRNDRLPSG